VGAATIRHAAGIAVVCVSIVAAAGTSNAQTCAVDPITARGEPSRFLWTAKVKARANWRRKVRAIERFGSAYSDWGKAAHSEEKCDIASEMYTCTAVATPCK